MEALVEQLLSSSEIDAVIRIQILDYNSYSANTLGERNKYNYPPFRIIEQTGLFKHSMATTLREGKI